jgi:hypothetical protein
MWKYNYFPADKSKYARHVERHELASFHSSSVYSGSLFPSVKSTLWISPECVPTIHYYRFLSNDKECEVVRTNEHFGKSPIFICDWFESDPFVNGQS